MLGINTFSALRSVNIIEIQLLFHQLQCPESVKNIQYCMGVILSAAKGLYKVT